MKIDLKSLTKEERLLLEEDLCCGKWNYLLGAKPKKQKEIDSVRDQIVWANMREYGRDIASDLPFSEGSMSEHELRFHVLSNGSEYVIDETTVKIVLLTGIDKNAPKELVEAFEQAAELWKREQRHHSRRVRIENSNVAKETTNIKQE